MSKDQSSKDIDRHADLIQIDEEDSLLLGNEECADLSDSFFEDLVETDPKPLDDTETTGTPNDAYTDIDSFEDGWLDDSAEEAPAAAEDMIHDLKEDADWKGDNKDETLPPDTSWFGADVADDAAPFDDGAEGPAHPESFDIDETKWDELPLDDEDEPREDVFESMRRVDVQLVDFDKEDFALQDPFAPDIAVSFLGPEHGRAADALFFQGRPIAVGDHLFVLGADGQFHPTIETLPLKLGASSLAWYDDAVFVGTAKRGALLTSDLGGTIKPVNSWYTEGFRRKGEVRSNECSTSFSVTGHFHPSRFRLFGLTGEGQIYISEDFGESWQGPLLKGCCTALAACTGDETLWALTRGPADTVVLYKSRDLAVWDTVSLPPQLHRHLTPTDARVRAGGKSVVVFEKNSSCPMFFSKDRGATWKKIPYLSNVTALTLDPEDGRFMIAGVSNRDGSAQAIISFDGGQTRHVALTVEPSKEEEDGAVFIHSFALNLDEPRRISAVTSRGIYLLTFPQKEIKH